MEKDVDGVPATMMALVLTDAGPQLDCAYPTPAPGPGEALVRVRKAGICSTDLELVRGYKGGFRGVLGHEFVGEVVALHEGMHEGGGATWLGRRVVGEINIGCGCCARCMRGEQKHCATRSALGIVGRDGAFTEYLTLPVANLHAVPPGVRDSAAAFAEPLAAALQLLEQIHVAPSARVYVLGDGRLGQLVAQVMQTTACALTLIGRTRDKLAIAALRGIQTATLEAIDALAAEPADVVVEVTGSPDGFALARRLVRPGGTLALKSTFASRLANFDASALVVDEITLVGSRCGPFAPALELLRRNAVEPRPLISATSPLAHGVEALDYAAQRGVLKVQLDMVAQGVQILEKGDAG
jgi:threonine dehydrogenase-like Zn-dependent dehydrogenase